MILGWKALASHLAFHGSFSHMNTVSNYRGPSQLGSSVSIVLEWNILGISFTLTQLYKFEKDLITCLTYPSCLQSWNWVKGFSQCRVQLIEHHVCNSQTTTNRGHLHRVVPGAGKVRVSRLQPSLDPIHFQELLDHIGNLIGWNILHFLCVEHYTFYYWNPHWLGTQRSKVLAATPKHHTKERWCCGEDTQAGQCLSGHHPRKPAWSPTQTLLASFKQLCLGWLYGNYCKWSIKHIGVDGSLYGVDCCIPQNKNKEPMGA